MADNVTIPAQGTGDTTPVVATDLVSGAHYQRMKLALGGDGTAADAASGAGVVDATVQRVTLGSDDPAVADLNILAAQVLDYNTGVGTANTAVMGLALPSGSGPVAGGTTTNPLNVAVVAGTAVMGHVITDSGSTTAVTQATAASLNATVVGAGTAGTANAGVVTVQGIASMTKLLVTPDSVALPANQSVNVSQINAVTPLMGSGNTGTGSLRVTIATDQPQLTNKLLVTPDANSAVNVSQINGVTPLMGAGNTGTGSPRVTIATDQVVIPVGGNVAHDAVDSGNPVKVGYKAISFGANPTAVAASDRTDGYANRAGVPWVLGGHPNIITIEAEYTSAQTNTAIVTVSSGAIIVVTQIQAVLDEATTVGVGLRVGFAAATTPTTTGVVLTHPGMVPGSGISRGDGSGILGAGADGEDLRITSEAATSGALRILVSYFTIES